MSLIWHYPAMFPALSQDEVHIWQVALDVPTSHIRSLEQILTANERSQAERFRLPIDTARFIIARGTLRVIMGRYLNQEPATVQFRYGRYGKPYLAKEADNSLRFNVTHSHGTALYAIAQGRDVGVDLEYINNDMAYEQNAEYQFARDEVNALHAIPSGYLRRETFFHIWTRKEAFLKATGLGLSLDLRTFNVPVAPVMSATLWGAKAEWSTVSRWSLHDLPATSDFVAALVVEGSPCALTCWQWLGEEQ